MGDAIRLRAGALGGTLDGIVTDIGITYVRFDTDGSVMSIPNSQVLNAVVGPIPPTREEDPPVGRRRQVGHAGRPGAASAPPGRAYLGHGRTKGRLASQPALRHADRCGGRLSAKGTTRLQPNGIPRRQ